MSCERYWREGILRVEHGELDPHRDTCAECHHAHDLRAELVRALPLVGGRDTGDPSWEARVWNRIARLERPAAARRWLGGSLAMAFAAILTCWAIGHHPDNDAERFATPDHAQVEILHGDVAMRSTTAEIGDRVRIAVKPTEEVRVYCDARLVLRCSAGFRDRGCVTEGGGLVAELRLAAAGDYRLVVITSATADPVGGLVGDLAAVVAAGGEYLLTELPGP